MSRPLTEDIFIDNFKFHLGWTCAEGSRINKELREFAKEREGSMRNIDELHVIFCMSHNIDPSLKSKE